MKQYLKNYWLSLLVVAAILYLSFFRPPSTELSKILHIDKVVHFCMYFGLSGMLWLEFLYAYRRSKRPPFRHAWIGALLVPILFSGCIELLQEYCTDYRGGDWLDLATNSCGALVASGVAYWCVYPWMRKRYMKKTDGN